MFRYANSMDPSQHLALNQAEIKSEQLLSTVSIFIQQRKIIILSTKVDYNRVQRYLKIYHLMALLVVY